jgi:hypothetical protein
MKVPAGPASMLSLDEQRRVMVERSLVENALKLGLGPGASADLWSLLGSEGQLQVLPPSSELARLRDEFDKGSAERGIPWDSASDHDTGVLRRLASFAKVTCHREPAGKKLRFTLSADATALFLPEILPPETKRLPARVVVFVRGEVLEFWSFDLWKATNVIQDVREFTADAKSVLEAVPEAEN